MKYCHFFTFILAIALVCGNGCKKSNPDPDGYQTTCPFCNRSFHTEDLKAKPNIALGLFEEFNYEMESMTLPKGTRLVLYTDGVTEAERVDKQQYGEERLLAWATENAQLDNAQEACDSLYKSVKNFTDGAEQNDDITIMTIRL